MAENIHEIKDKVFLVTGGAAGIGAGISAAFIENGAKHVAALDIDTASGTKLEKELSEKYGAGKYKFYKCDVTSNDLEETYDAVLKEQGYIDAVVNCAGIMNDNREMYLKEISVNVSALITSSLKAYDIMRKDRGGKGGTIINISSMVALYQPKALPIYSATKSAVLQFSNGLGGDFHYSRSGVRVITICFGMTETSLFSPNKMAGFDKECNDFLEVSTKRLPYQKPESAVKGLLEAYKVGKSASTFYIGHDKPAQDITENVMKSYAILSQGVFLERK